MACGRAALVTQVGVSFWLFKLAGFVRAGHQVVNIQKATSRGTRRISQWEKKLGQHVRNGGYRKKDSEEIDAL